MPKNECHLFHRTAFGYTGRVIKCFSEVESQFNDSKKIGYVLDLKDGNLYYRKDASEEFLQQATPDVFLYRTCKKEDNCEKEITYHVDHCDHQCNGTKISVMKCIEGVYFDLALDRYFQERCGRWIELSPENNQSKKDVSLVQRYVIGADQADLLIDILPFLETSSVEVVEKWSQNLDQLNNYQLTDGGSKLYVTFGELPEANGSVVLVYQGQKKLKYACDANEYLCFVVNVILERTASAAVTPRVSVDGPGERQNEYEIGDSAELIGDSNDPAISDAMEKNHIPGGAINSLNQTAGFWSLPGLAEGSTWESKYDIPGDTFDVQRGYYTVPEDGEYLLTAEFYYSKLEVQPTAFLGYFVILVKSGDTYRIYDCKAFNHQAPLGVSNVAVGHNSLTTGASLKTGDMVYPALYDLVTSDDDPGTPPVPTLFNDVDAFLYRAGTSFTATKLK